MGTPPSKLLAGYPGTRRARKGVQPRALRTHNWNDEVLRRVLAKK
jgi:hypothetical protein